jgi:hypothetical protein
VVGVKGVQLAEDRVAQPHRFFEHRVEYGAEVAGRELITCNTSAVAVPRARLVPIPMPAPTPAA